jgi:transcriptional regulator with XRE-family HTH domain
MSALAERLHSEFSDKEYRHAYADEFLNSYIATQIQVLREERGWSQEHLAQEAGMKQSRISLLENVGYSSWSISTLKRLAEAFDLTLRVSFESFGRRLADIDQFNRESLERFSFDEDPAFQHGHVAQLLQSVAATEGLKPSKESTTKDGNLYFVEAFLKMKNQREESQTPLSMPLQQELRQVAIK